MKGLESVDYWLRENKKLNEKISHTPFIFFIRKIYFLENKNKYFCFYNRKNINKERKWLTLMASGNCFGCGGGGGGRVVKLTVEEKIKQVLRESATLA